MLLKIIYIKETQKTCDIIKEIILKIKYFFNMIDVEYEENKIIYYLPLVQEKKYSKNKIKKISKKIIKNLEKNGSNNVALSIYLNTLTELKNNLYSENVNILDGRYLFKCLTEEIIKYILKIKNEDIRKTEISILVNDLDEFNQNLIIDLAKEVRTINIITNHIDKWKKIEEKLYNEFGILLNISNNKKNSLMYSKIIINIDFPTELINKYKIYDSAIIINTLGKIQIKSKKFNGTNINYFEIKIPKKYKMEGFENEIVYESIIYKKGLYEAKSIILKDKIKIKKFIGNNGYIKENEFIAKHLTKFG